MRDTFPRTFCFASLSPKGSKIDSKTLNKKFELFQTQNLPIFIKQKRFTKTHKNDIEQQRSKAAGKVQARVSRGASFTSSLAFVFLFLFPDLKSRFL